MSGQLTLTEMAVMVTMGAVISPSLQAPDRGIALGVLAMLCTLLFQRGTTWWAFHHSRFEDLTQGETSMLIKVGILQLDTLTDTRISKQQVFAQLRSQNIYKLSTVKRMYIEASGRALASMPNRPTSRVCPRCPRKRRAYRPWSRS